MESKTQKYLQKRRALEKLPPGALIARLDPKPAQQNNLGVLLRKFQWNEENHFVDVLYKGKIETWHLSKIEILT
jgi:hypothetical protein